jgi:NitT/TauT family transport system permease protein
MTAEPLPRPTSPRAAPAGALTRRLKSLLPPTVLGAFLLLAWEIASSTGAVSAFFLPPPGSVAKAFGDALWHGSLLDYTWQTVLESAAGSGLGIAVALPVGYFVARGKWAARALQPYIAASQAVPAVALAPLLALWLGYGLLPIAVLCALLVFFPMLVNTVLGLRSLDVDVLNAARVDGVTRWGMIRYIEIPLALPSILTGVRAGFTLSITGAVVGEFVMGGDGLGQLLAVQRNEADSVGLFVTLFTLALLAVCAYGLMRLVEERAQR